MKKIYVSILDSWNDRTIALKKFNEDQKLEAFEYALKLSNQCKKAPNMSVDIFTED